MGRRAGESIEDWSIRRRLESRTHAEIARDEANEAARIAELNRPRSQKAMPACAFMHAKRREMVKESVEYFQRDPEERAAEPETEEAIRKAISKEHRKLNTEGGDPSRLKELIAKKRSRK